MNYPRSRPLVLTFIAGGILFTMIILRLQPRGASGPEPLGGAQAPAAITGDAFAKDEGLFQAIHAEAQRRLLVAGNYLGVLGEVLPAPLRHLYVINSYEQVFRAKIDLSQLPAMTAPPTPVLPPVDDLIKAYRALHEDELANLAEQLTESPSSGLIGNFLEAMAKPEIQRKRLVFAREHQADIVPK